MIVHTGPIMAFNICLLFNNLFSFRIGMEYLSQDVKKESIIQSIYTAIILRNYNLIFQNKKIHFIRPTIILHDRISNGFFINDYFIWGFWETADKKCIHQILSVAKGLILHV